MTGYEGDGDEGEDLELVLLHEMAHIGSAGAAHGPQFRRKLRRLLRLGAPARLLDDLERYDTGRVVNPSLTGEPS